MITPAWTPLRYHPVQSALWRTTKRFVAVVAGRGSGKTDISRRRIVRYLPIKKPWPDPLYFYALPTREQAKRVAWNAILKLIPPAWFKGEPNRSEMSIQTVFGSTLYIVGLDKPQRIEGLQYDGGIVDESSDQRPGHFERTIRPALSHRNGWCWRIGIPKRWGVGAADFREFSRERCDECFHWSSEDILTSEELQEARNQLSTADYNEQYCANWETVGGQIFYAFSPEHNIKPVVYQPDLPIVVGSDFNVSPMAWVIGHFVDNTLHVFDELFLRNTNTQLTLDALYARYGSHNAGWLFFGDASSRARKTSARETDYVQIKNDTRFRGSRVFYDKSNPAVADRFAATNTLLRSASGQSRLFINPKCLHLIADLIARSWDEHTREPDDMGDIGHMTDALGYIIWRKWPLKYQQTNTTQVSIV